MQKLFVVYDSKSETYTAPTVNPSVGQAIRSFSDAVNKGGSVLSDHPADFTLFEIGDYDPHTASITLLEAKKVHVNGMDVKTVV